VAQPVVPEQRAEAAVQHLSGELTIHSATERKPELLALLETGEDLVLNVSQISELDTAGLQLLLMLKREAAQLGRRLALVEPSGAVGDILAITHLTHELDPRPGDEPGPEPTPDLETTP
jgi:anti-anti-sigma factor